MTPRPKRERQQAKAGAVSRRTRIFLGVLLIYFIGIAFLLYRVVADIDPRYRESAEAALVEISLLMAGLVTKRHERRAVYYRANGPKLQELAAFIAELAGPTRRGVTGRPRRTAGQ